ncbi:MAG: sugar isomerase domain-containing protein [Anaerolineales bacterium]|nr:sugar isomerase domain-containing protein [Anaerolineales bacterium]
MTAKNYWKKMREILTAIEEEEWESIVQTAKMVADLTQSGDMIHVFGPGHTHTLVDEMWVRAGGLASINPIHDAGMTPAFGPAKGSALERLEGYGRILFDTHNAKPGELMIVVSNIGNLPVVVDVGLAAKEADLTMVTLASLDFSKSSKPLHSSGKKLYEFADIVIDNKCPPGEAALDIEEYDRRVGPATMIANAWILNAIVVEAVSIMLDRGETPPVFRNFNLMFVPGEAPSTPDALLKPYHDRLTVMDFH